MTTPPEARERLEVFLREDVEPALADGKSLLVRDLPALAADLRAALQHIDGLEARLNSTPGPFGAWSEEGQTKSGRFKHSLCRNDQGCTPEGDLICSFEETGHVCIAEVYGNTPEQAHANAVLLATSANSITSLTAERDGLREALKPFAAVPDVVHVWNQKTQKHDVARPPDGDRASIFYITYGDLRRARSALSPAPAKPEANDEH